MLASLPCSATSMLMPEKPSSPTEITGRVIRFEHRGRDSRPQRASRVAVQDAPVAGQGEHADSADDRNEYRHRMKTNAATLVVVCLLIWGGLWLADAIAQFRKTQDCVLSGRRNCAPIAVPAHVR